MNVIKFSFCFFLFSFLPILLFSQGISTQEIEIKNGLFSLTGTLSYYKEVKQPLVIFVAGSGNIDRNGNQNPMVKASYIQQLSDSLNHYQIAVFRYDKRTANAQNLSLKEMKDIRFEDFSDDVVTILNHFKAEKQFTRIYIIGHSQGSLTSMLALQKEDADGFISVAGVAEPIKNVLISQLKKQNQTLADKADEHFSELMKNDTITSVHPFLMSIFAPGNQKFLKSWNHYDPVLEISKLNIPMLIINGTADLQVPISVAQMLHEAQPSSKLVIVENMTHTLKIIEKTTDNLLTYSTPDFPISSELVQSIVQFIKE